MPPIPDSPALRDDVDTGARDAAPSRRITSADVLLVLLLIPITLYFLRPNWFQGAALQAWSTVFVAVCLQALPFLVVGVLLSAASTVFVPPSFLERALPGRTALAVPAAEPPGRCCPVVSAPPSPWPAASSAGA